MNIRPIGALCLFSALLKDNANKLNQTLAVLRVYITNVSYSYARSGGISETTETSRTLCKLKLKKNVVTIQYYHDNYIGTQFIRASKGHINELAVLTRFRKVI